MSNNKIFFIILTVIIIVIIAIIYYKNSETTIKKHTIENHFKKGVDHDTIYYKITDISGNTSSIHDSGIKPSKISEKVKIPVLKIEYNETQVKKIDNPVLIEHGRQIFDLKNKIKITPEIIEDKGDFYLIEIKVI
jgi:hypothetical protein